MNTIFLIKPYSPYISPAEGEIIRHIFKVYDQDFAICEAYLDWGKANVAVPIEQEDTFGYYYYNTYEEALEYANIIKRLAK